MNFANKNIYLLMQVNDSVFPIGGYTQSYGLETYIQKRIVDDKDTACDYIIKNLNGPFLHAELLSASLAYDMAIDNDIDQITEMEKIICVSKTAQEIREASNKLGSRFVKTILTTDAIAFDSQIFNTYAKKINDGEIVPNHAVAYGIFCASIGIEKDIALSFFLYSSTSAMVINSVKAVPLSQTNGQQILLKCHDEFDKLVEKVKTLTITDLCTSMPGYDIRCMQHEVLYSRLYMS